MLIRYCLLLFLSLALPHSGSATLSDVICDDSTRLKEQLSRSMGVKRQGQGLRGPDTLIEIWIAPRSGDWTMIQTYTNGISCIVAMGEHWETLTVDPDPA